VLCGHKEACDELPAGATLLLSGEACPVQMFRVGENVYATQFHPEGDSEGFTVRIQAYKHHGNFQPEESDTLIAAVNRQETLYAREILRRFVERQISQNCYRLLVIYYKFCRQNLRTAKMVAMIIS